jgi:hypothetical protein
MALFTHTVSPSESTFSSLISLILLYLGSA